MHYLVIHFTNIKCNTTLPKWASFTYKPIITIGIDLTCVIWGKIAMFPKHFILIFTTTEIKARYKFSILDFDLRLT